MISWSASADVGQPGVGRVSFEDRVFDFALSKFVLTEHSHVGNLMRPPLKVMH